MLSYETHNFEHMVINTQCLLAQKCAPNVIIITTIKTMYKKREKTISCQKQNKKTVG